MKLKRNRITNNREIKKLDPIYSIVVQTFRLRDRQTETGTKTIHTTTIQTQMGTKAERNINGQCRTSKIILNWICIIFFQCQPVIH